MSKEDTCRSVHQRLLNIRDSTGEQFNHLLMRYGQERFLSPGFRLHAKVPGQCRTGSGRKSESCVRYCVRVPNVLQWPWLLQFCAIP